jgi:hypothetical protein
MLLRLPAAVLQIVFIETHQRKTQQYVFTQNIWPPKIVFATTMRRPKGNVFIDLN